MKETIRLRRKTTTSGEESLYLDIYLNGKRKYEFLKLYLVPEITKADKKKNAETMKLAEAIKAKRIVELQNKEFGFKNDYAEETKFFEFYRSMVEERRGAESRSNWGNWQSALKHLEKYEKNKNITFAEITPAWIMGFKKHLDNYAKAWEHDGRIRTDIKPLSKNSKYSYFNKLRACINHAFNERIISRNPMIGIEGFKEEESTRLYLTFDEVKALANTDCEYPRIKDAFLFSCLTGLRRSDILKLTWGEVSQHGEYTRLIFKQKKTKGLEYLDIAPQAAELLGERGKPNEAVFPDILSPSCTNNAIQRWVLRAGIDKKITFHCGRHTFAVMMLDLGTDIYTVSKLLGHRMLSTTQIYAKVVDKNKQAAVSKIPDLF